MKYSLSPQTPKNPPATSLTPRTYPLHEVNELTRQTIPPTPQTILTSATSGTFRDFWKKTTTKKIGFYFFTYEWSRRRLSLIKMINGVEEALILLFAAFKYENLFWSTVVRAWKVRLVVLEKNFICRKTHDKKKEEGKPKISGEKNVS